MVPPHLPVLDDLRPITQRDSVAFGNEKPKSMRIVHVNTNDITGGAARATYRLHQGLQRLGHESLMYVLARKSDDPSVLQYVPSRRPDIWAKRFLRKKYIDRTWASPDFFKGREFFSDSRTRFGVDLIAQMPACDIVNLHWIANFIDYGMFFGAVPDHVPLVWRLADMSALTGGCHFDNGCGKFKEGCGACPKLDSSSTDDLSRRVWQRKRRAFGLRKNTGLHIVALCGWMRDQVKQSPLLSRFPVTIIPNGIDLTDFSPRDKCSARDAIGVPHDANVLLFVADSAIERRKGLWLLAEALKCLGDVENLFLLSVGQGKPEVNGPIRHLHLGPVEYRRLSLVYSAADLFVIPSLEDNLPNTVLESMACGTPVIGFAVGGIPDMIRHERTGLLVPSLDVSGLRLAIAGLLSNAARRREMSIRSRQVALAEYSLELQARRYSDLYQTLVTGAALISA